MEGTILQLDYSLENINEALEEFWGQLSAWHIFAFSGEMSAGKTTFISRLCEYLEVDDTVSSPTFSLINEYHFDMSGKDTIIFHMDWYRLKSAEEALNAGIEDCLLQANDKKVFCFVEWPERALEIIPRPYIWLSIDSPTPTTRTMVAKLVS